VAASSVVTPLVLKTLATNFATVATGPILL
jgi:hypothetical protein